jgi:hypothetical protein
MRRSFPAHALGALLLAAPLLAQDAPKPAAAAPIVKRFDKLQLSVSLPGEWGMTEADSSDPQIQQRWRGKLGASELVADLIVLPQRDFAVDEPTGLIDIIGKYRADPKQGGNVAFHFDEVTHVQGKYGVASYACVASSVEPTKDGEARVLRLAGLVEGSGYVLELHCAPPPADAKSLRDALVKCVESDATPREPKWTDAEVKERWKASVPDELADKLDDVLRTNHYLILTNSSGGKAFAKKMEDCYAAIRKVFPFDEVPGRRLMPVFLFRTNDQFYAFLGKQLGWSAEQAKQAKGVAFLDLYTTWYEAPGDPVHIHEATHQIFKNRMFLDGGGSWFQEGVAEFMCTKDDDRGAAATAVKKGKHVPLPKFVTIESLLYSNAADSKNESNDVPLNQYQQAALFIEFLSKSKFGKAKFLDAIHALGATPSNDVGAIQAALQRVYGTDLDGAEKQFEDYCKKR